MKPSDREGARTDTAKPRRPGPGLAPRGRKKASLPKPLDKGPDFDARLVEAIRRGDDNASAPLYPHLRPSIEGGLRRVLKPNRPDFEDLVQQTFERVVRSILAGGFEGRSALTTWAQAIAANVALDTVRRSFVETRYLQNLNGELFHMTPNPVSTEQRLEARSSLRLVESVLSRMNPVSARATTLRSALEYPVADVARELGMSTTATASRIRRARAELNRRLNLRAVGL